MRRLTELRKLVCPQLRRHYSTKRQRSRNTAAEVVRINENSQGIGESAKKGLL
jgi:hypothetical protein